MQDIEIYKKASKRLRMRNARSFRGVQTVQAKKLKPVLNIQRATTASIAIRNANICTKTAMKAADYLEAMQDALKLSPNEAIRIIQSAYRDLNNDIRKLDQKIVPSSLWGTLQLAFSQLKNAVVALLSYLAKAIPNGLTLGLAGTPAAQAVFDAWLNVLSVMDDINSGMYTRKAIADARNRIKFYQLIAGDIQAILTKYATITTTPAQDLMEKKLALNFYNKWEKLIERQITELATVYREFPYYMNNILSAINAFYGQIDHFRGRLLEGKGQPDGDVWQDFYRMIAVIIQRFQDVVNEMGGM